MIRGPLAHAVAAVVVAAALLCGCIAIADFGSYDTSRGGGGDDGGAPDGRAGLSIVAVAPLAVRRGKSVTFAITVDRAGEVVPLAIDMPSLPVGLSVAPAVVPVDASSTTLTITTTLDAPLGPFTALVRASATVGTARATSLVTVDVRTTQLDPTFGNGGLVVGKGNEVFQDFAGVDDGTSFLAVAASKDSDAATVPRLHVYRLDGTGAVETFLDRDDGDANHDICTSAGGDLVMTSAAGLSTTVEAYSLASRQRSWSTALDLKTTNGSLPSLSIAADGTIFILSSGSGADMIEGTFVRRLSAQGTDPSVGAGAYRLPSRALASEGSAEGAPTGRGFVVCTNRSQNASDELVVRRMADDGGLDQTFGAGGELIISSPSGSRSLCRDVVVDGARLIVGANIGLPGTADGLRAALFGIDGDGRLDAAFGISGVAARTDPSNVAANAVTVAPGGVGPIYVAGSDSNGALVFVDRADGTSDPSFGAGDGGILPIRVGNSSAAQAVHVLADGRILVAGTTEVADGPTWFVARYLP